MSRRTKFITVSRFGSSIDRDQEIEALPLPDLTQTVESMESVTSESVTSESVTPAVYRKLIESKTVENLWRICFDNRRKFRRLKKALGNFAVSYMRGDRYLEAVNQIIRWFQLFVPTPGRLPENSGLNSEIIQTIIDNSLRLLQKGRGSLLSWQYVLHGMIASYELKREIVDLSEFEEREIAFAVRLRRALNKKDLKPIIDELS